LDISSEPGWFKIYPKYLPQKNYQVYLMKTQKNSLRLQITLFSGLFLVLFLSSCSFFAESETNNTVTITGLALHETTGDPVADAIVRITQPQAFQETTVTDSNGRFTFSNLRIETDVQFTIEITKDNFHASTRHVIAEPGAEVNVGNVQMRLLTEEPPDDDDDEVSGEAGGAAALILTNITDQAINIRETGGIVNSAFTFVAQDSAGRSVDAGQTVFFEIVAGPNGGEELTPSSVQTDASGSVTSNLLSGYGAGVVKIEARIERPDVGLTIRSKPITIAIHGGFPDLDHFSIAIQTFNFEGWAINGIRNPVTVIVGDKFSNPVKPETPVYFGTEGGIIQGSGFTDADGQATVDLISGDPRPAGGYGIITAVTYDEDDNEISKQIPVLFSGPPSSDNISISPGVFNVPAGQGQIYSLTVTDINGNPLPSGTSVTVEMENDVLTLAGDYDITIPNSLDPGVGITEFLFSVRDNDDDNEDTQSYDITVVIQTPNGYTARRTFSD
jgi:hypothetical protein